MTLLLKRTPVLPRAGGGRPAVASLPEAGRLHPTGREVRSVLLWGFIRRGALCTDLLPMCAMDGTPARLFVLQWL